MKASRKGVKAGQRGEGKETAIRAEVNKISESVRGLTDQLAISSILEAKESQSIRNK